MSPARRLVLAVAALAVHAGIFALIAWQPAWLRGGDGPRQRILHPDRLMEIVDQLRAHRQGEWLEDLAAVEVVLMELEQERDDCLSRVVERYGAAYGEELQRLAANHHHPVAEVDPRAAGADLPAVWTAVRDAERAVHNRYIDILAARNALRHESSALDAVARVQVVAPDREPVDAVALRAVVRDRTRLDAFKAAVVAGDSLVDAMRKGAELVLRKVRHGEGMGDLSGLALIPGGGAGSVDGETLPPDGLDLRDTGSSGGPFEPLPGRVLAGDPARVRSLFVDKWYVMGPFENRHRSRMDASFLPETLVDLDATTVGKDGRTLRWEYLRSDRLRIQPAWAEPESVYYAWTEIRVEEPGEYWVALGSDDYGKLWINGERVWSSDTGPKSFKADEEVVSFRFREGLNELLFRCENFRGTMGWSLVVLNEGGM